jgi:hypothetical protein
MSIPPKIRFEVFQRDGFKCAYCGKDANQAILEVDHIIPEAKGGKTELGNLQTACFECNRGKSAKDVVAAGTGPSLDSFDGLPVIAPGYLAAVVLKRGSFTTVPVGQVQAVDDWAIRLTLVDWITGRFTGSDLLIPRKQIKSILLATPLHSAELFGDEARWLQEQMRECGGNDD